MKVIDTGIEGLIVFEPKVFEDSRGYFFESYNQREFEEAVGHKIQFVQDNQSSSKKGVLRGLHFQKPPFTQAKLIRCILGEVLDVALDLRSGSTTYGKCFTIKLSAENKRALYIPHGFAHGFSVLSEEAIFQYKCDNFYHPESEGGIFALDDCLSINWGIEDKDMILSDKDKQLPLFKDFKSPF